jgi:hypothetical protein
MTAPLDDDLAWFAAHPGRCFRLREATREERAPLLTGKEAALVSDMVMLFDFGTYALVRRDPQTGALETSLR